eukprot:COSAG04_NODE_950_length_9211_cov_69.923068_3_plen_111_part_00
MHAVNGPWNTGPLTCCAGHWSQSPLLELPTTAELCPASQSTHESAAGASEYRPATQSMQSLDDVLAILTVYLPAPQSMQSDSAGLPTVDEYLPTTQAMQAEAATATACSE